MLRDYPYTTVPNQVQRLFRAQQLHDRKQYDARLAASPEARAKMPYTNYLRPIVADGDTGYGVHHSDDTKRLYNEQAWRSVCGHEAHKAVCRIGMSMCATRILSELTV